MVQLTLASRLSHIKTDRAAVIPYIVMNDSIYFLLGIDDSSGDITDFGGGVKQYEYALSAAIREFKEESDEIFGTLYNDINRFSTNIALLDRRMSVIFVPIDIKWYNTARQIFKEKNMNSINNEVSDIIWVNEDQFRQMAFSRDSKLWIKLQRFYQEGFKTDKLSRALRITYSRIC